MVVQCSGLIAELCEVLSHRGRSSLTVICGALDDLASGFVLSEEELNDARESAAKLASMYDELRSLSRSLPTAENQSEQLERTLMAVKR